MAPTITAAIATLPSAAGDTANPVSSPVTVSAVHISSHINR
jgi:hypothetical protein